MIGRADIEGSKSDVAMNAWPPQASYPCADERIERPMLSQSLRVLSVRDQASFCPFALREVSVLAELALGHLRYSLTDVPPQSNSPPGGVLGSDHATSPGGRGRARRRADAPRRTTNSTRRARRDGPRKNAGRRDAETRAPFDARTRPTPARPHDLEVDGRGTLDEPKRRETRSRAARVHDATRPLTGRHALRTTEHDERLSTPAALSPTPTYATPRHVSEQCQTGPGRERDATPANDAREGVDGAPLIATRPDTTEARSSGVPRKPGDEHPTAARQPQPANDAETPNGVAVSNGKAPSNPVSASARPEPEPPRSSEPILIPKLRIDFVDFPYLHYSMRLEAAHLGDLLRISVRTGAKTPRGPLPDFHGPRGDHGHRRSERCSSRSRPYLPASGFQGRTTLTEKRELFPDPPAASPGSFRLPGRGTRQRDARNADAARLRAPNTRERFRAGFRNTDRIPFRPTYDRVGRGERAPYVEHVAVERRLYVVCLSTTRERERRATLDRAFVSTNEMRVCVRDDDDKTRSQVGGGRPSRGGDDDEDAPARRSSSLHWVQDFSPGLGSTDSWTTAVHKKPFSTAAPEDPSRVFATTTKICTDGGSRRPHGLPFCAHRRALLLVRAYRVSSYTLLSGFRLPWPPSCCHQRPTPFMGSEIRVDLGALTRRSVHPAAPVLLTKNGPLSANGSVAGFASTAREHEGPGRRPSRCAERARTRPAYQESPRSRPFITTATSDAPRTTRRRFVPGASYPEGNFGGNQLLDGSISLSPLYPAQTIDLHVRIAADLHQVRRRPTTAARPPSASPTYGRDALGMRVSGRGTYATAERVHGTPSSPGDARSVAFHFHYAFAQHGSKRGPKFVADRRRRERRPTYETPGEGPRRLPARKATVRADAAETRHRRATAETAAQTNLKRAPEHRRANGSRRPTPSVEGRRRKYRIDDRASREARPAVGPEFRAPGFTGSVRLPPNGFTYY
ncbi:hypothetical protein V9T40_009801 [Parthenolecanium corni]|uniref:Uncharacterized protein n=1 Tax=Parthenolecanium corni TaxID=536013 RepID=A0AAN9TKH1_9HEMI